jgi:hypothetical protein
LRPILAARGGRREVQLPEEIDELKDSEEIETGEK